MPVISNASVSLVHHCKVNRGVSLSSASAFQTGEFFRHLQRAAVLAARPTVNTPRALSNCKNASGSRNSDLPAKFLVDVDEIHFQFRLQAIADVAGALYDRPILVAGDADRDPVNELFAGHRVEMKTGFGNLSQNDPFFPMALLCNEQATGTYKQRECPR